MNATRRLAAILAADVAGYSRLIGADESGTLQALKAIRAELIDPTIAAHNGRLVNDGWTVMPETDRRESIDLARQSLRAAQDDPSILVTAAFVLGHFGEDVRAMLG